MFAAVWMLHFKCIRFHASFILYLVQTPMIGYGMLNCNQKRLAHLRISLTRVRDFQVKFTAARKTIKSLSFILICKHWLIAFSRPVFVSIWHNKLNIGCTDLKLDWWLSFSKFCFTIHYCLLFYAFWHTSVIAPRLVIFRIPFDSETKLIITFPPCALSLCP